MTDSIADMLTRIRNAQMAKKSEVVIPFSKVKFRIAEILKDQGYLENVEVIENNFTEIKIKLKYNADKTPLIKSLKAVSTSGCRIYAKKEKLPTVLNGLGMAIISTSKGLMTNQQAKQAGVGGEVICEIY